MSDHEHIQVLAMAVPSFAVEVGYKVSEHPIDKKGINFWREKHIKTKIC